MTRLAWMALVVGAALAMAPATATVPLCPGLTIVTAVHQPDGDYESIKTVESVSETMVRLKYSTERQVSDIFSNEPPKLQKLVLFRSVRRADLDSATLYQQQFSTELPELIPDTTAIGVSRAVLEALKTNGRISFGIFQAYSTVKPTIERSTHPNVYDNQMVAPIARAGSTTVPILVNDSPTSLPAIRATGDFYGDRSEFLFLDDPANPLTLKFRFGIDAVKAEDPAIAAGLGRPPRPAGDRDVLEVVKISYGCTAIPGADGSSAIERALASSGKVDVYSIYFSFGSDAIRDESAPTLKEIADVLARHPDWKLGVNGHTDGVGADQYNLDLSKKRAAAVKTALVSRYGVPAGRLTSAGFGKSQPRDTNDTLEGRARNRRVELIKVQ